MADITFNTGTASYTITTPAVVYGTDFYDERFGQSSLRTGDGNLVTYDDGGPTITHGLIVMKGVTRSEAEGLKTWLRESAVYMLNKFTITPPALLDLGKGQGQSIAFCSFDGTTDKGVFQFVTPGVYTIKFPFSFVRTTNTNIKGSIPITFTLSGTL